MFMRLIRNLTMLALLATMASLQACSPAAIADGNAVAEAYSSPDALIVQPYNRSIFSSSNF